MAPTQGRTDALLAGTEVRIGIGCPLTGSSAFLGREMKQAVELAIDEQNAAGGVLGARVIGEVRDDGSDAERAGALAEGLCAIPDLVGVVGHYNSDVGLRASEVYARWGLPMVNPITSNPALTDRGLANVLRVTNRDDVTGAAIAGYLVRARRKRFAMIFATESTYGTSMAECFARAFVRAGGIVMARRTIAEGERDFRGLVAGTPREFDVVFYGGTFEGAGLLKELRAAGLTQCFATGDGCWDARNFLEPAGGAAEEGEGVLVLSATPEMGRVPGSEGFRERYERRYGAIDNYAANSYDSARVLMKAIEGAARVAGGRPTRREVVLALRGISFQGIAYRGPIAWDEKGDNRNAVTALHVVENGRFRQVAEVSRGESGWSGEAGRT